ncbi:MAG TPA: DUF4190 domain-containing protein [Acidimicrobiales bacterium]
MSETAGDDVPRDPWGNPLGPEDRPPANPTPDDFPPDFPSEPAAPTESAPPTASIPTTPPAPAEPTTNPAWPGRQPARPEEPPSSPWADPQPSAPPPSNPAWPGQQAPPPAPGAPQWPGSPPPGAYGAPGQAPPPGMPGSQPGYGNWAGANPWDPPRREGTAVTALVLGILSLVCGFVGLFGVVLGPIAIWLGVSARRKIERSNGARTGEGLAIAAVVLGAIGLAVSVLYILLLILSPEFRDRFMDVVNNSG